MPMIYRPDDDNSKKSPKREFTMKEIDEFRKCINDIVYFAENYCYITNFKNGKQLIKLYDYQKEILKNYENNRFNIVQTTRQSGITTINLIYILYESIFEQDKTFALCSNNVNSSKDMLSDLKNIYENLPDFLKPGVVEYNAFNIKFDNKCEILSRGHINRNTFCGLSLDLVICDNFAFVEYEKGDEFFISSFPTILYSKGKFIITSTKNTENRKTNKFWELWGNAIDGKNEFKPYYINWEMVSGRDQNWKNNVVKSIGIEKFINEYEISYTHPNPLSHDQYGNKRYSPKEFAKLFNVSTSTVARWRTQGKINGIRLSERQFYYTEIDIKLIKTKDTLTNVLASEIFSEFNKELKEKLERTPDRKVFYIDCGNLPEDIVQKYVNELRERFKKDQI